MANLRSFTGFLALDVLGAQSIVIGDSSVFPPANELDILIQDGDVLLEGDTGTDEQSADPQGDQIGFVTNSDGEALLDGVEVYVESSFNFTLDGAGSFTATSLKAKSAGKVLLFCRRTSPQAPLLSHRSTTQSQACRMTT